MVLQFSKQRNHEEALCAYEQQSVVQNGVKAFPSRLQIR